MSLLGLPNELVRQVAQSLESEADINALVRTCQSLYCLLIEYLYLYNIKQQKACGLHWAIELGGEEATRRFLAAGADVRTKDDQGFTPLAIAAENGHEALVGLLLAQPGVDVESTINDTNQTPLSLAASYGYPSVVKILLADSRVNPNSLSIFEMTPLMWAAERGHEAVVKLLLADHRVDTQPNHLNATALTLAAAAGRTAIVSLLLSDGRFDVNQDTADGTPMSLAAKYGHLPVLRLLVEDERIDGAINMRPALRVAILRGSPDVARFLIEKDINLKETGGFCPYLLNIAARRGDKSIMESLLKRGLDPDGQNLSGPTPLITASRYGQEEVVKILVGTGRVNLNARDKHGRTAMSLTVEYGTTATLLFLLSKGADPNLGDNFGRTPLWWATKHRREEFVKLLLMDARVMPQLKDAYFGKSPLSLAAENGDKALVELLLTQGMDVQDRDFEGDTPLSLAEANNHEEVVELLRTAALQRLKD